MTVNFDLIESQDVDQESVKKYRERFDVGILEGNRIAKGFSLLDKLSAMRYRQDDYEDATTDDVVNGLIDLLINSIEIY